MRDPAEDARPKVSRKASAKASAEVCAEAPDKTMDGHAIEAAAQMLANRLRKKSRHLRKWARRVAVTCYRLYDRDIPEIPLVIDFYQGHLHVSHYARKRDVGPEWIKAMAAAAAQALEIAPACVYVKERRRQHGKAQYERFAASEERVAVGEGGLSFWLNLRDYLDTGLFLDHRLTRERIRHEAAGARFLNLYAYTGAFTVYAAAGGAHRTVSVDLSRNYLAWTRDNMTLNHLSGVRMFRDVIPVSQQQEVKHALVRADVGAFLRGCRQTFDLAVLDPPTFSNSKKMTGVLDIQRDHVELINHTMALLRPGGVLYFSTGYRRFKINRDRIHASSIEDISAHTTDEDMRARPGHQCFRLLNENAASA